MTWLVTVDVPNSEKGLTFKLKEYPKILEGRLIFFDKAGKEKNFPYEWCAIEEVFVWG